MNLSTNTSAEIITEIITRKYRSQKSALWSPLKILPTVGLDSAIYIRCLISQRGQPSGRPHAVRSMVTVKHDQTLLRQLPDPGPQFSVRNIHSTPDMCPAVGTCIPHIHQKQPLSLIQVFIQLCSAYQIPHTHPPVRLSYYILCRQAAVGQSAKKECAFAPSAHPCGALFCFIGAISYETKKGRLP